MSEVQHNVIITGVPPGAGLQPTAYPRRPIEELVQDEKQFALYAQATDLMMKTKAADMLSWFQVAGIHGSPEAPWDNVAGIQDPSARGYCTHASVLFPTWHRPYVLLFEQALVGCAVKIAAQYQGTDAGEWAQAAASLRAPYWDWARTAVPPREVIELATLTVTGPAGPLVLDPNPLLGYRYKSDEPQVDPRPQTVRCPTRENPTASNLAALTGSLQVLDNPNDPMRDRVYDTLNDANSWETFSNKRTSQGAFRNSLESIHDTIHVLVGGSGQMADPAVAAFDPLFWLHHTNVDRLLALWQSLHPDEWVSAVTGPGESGTFTIAENALVDTNTDLTPFWNGQTTFFKSSSPAVRQWTLLNYTYPEFAKAGDSATILAEVKRLYLDDEDDVQDDVAPTTGAAVPAQKAAAAPLQATPQVPQQASKAVAPDAAHASAAAPAPPTQQASKAVVSDAAHASAAAPPAQQHAGVTVTAQKAAAAPVHTTAPIAQHASKAVAPDAAHTTAAAHAQPSQQHAGVAVTTQKAAAAPPHATEQHASKAVAPDHAHASAAAHAPQTQQHAGVAVTAQKAAAAPLHATAQLAHQAAKAVAPDAAHASAAANAAAGVLHAVAGHAHAAAVAVAPSDEQIAFVHSGSARGGTRLDWLARIRVKAAAVGSSFTVLLFFGEPPADEHAWRGAANLVGVHAEFVNSRPGACSNCQRNADVVTEGFVRLTRALRLRGLYGRPEAEIEGFLQENLEWRIQKIDAAVVGAGEVAGLEVAVMTVPLEFSQERHGWKKPDAVRPTHRNVTHARAGGRALPR